MYGERILAEDNKKLAPFKIKIVSKRVIWVENINSFKNIYNSFKFYYIFLKNKKKYNN